MSQPSQPWWMPRPCPSRGPGDRIVGGRHRVNLEVTAKRTVVDIFDADTKSWDEAEVRFGTWLWSRTGTPVCTATHWRPKGPPPASPAEIHDRAAQLITLPPNWDSYGAVVIDSAALEFAVHIAAALNGLASFALVPTMDGGACLEAHEGGVDVVVEIHRAVQ